MSADANTGAAKDLGGPCQAHVIVDIGRLVLDVNAVCKAATLHFAWAVPSGARDYRRGALEVLKESANDGYPRGAQGEPEW